MATDTIGTLDYQEIVFPKLGIDITVDSTAFQIGNLSIQWYGILITLGLILAMIYAFTQVRKYGLHPDGVLDAVIGGIIGAIIGARAYYVLLNWDNYAGDWKSIFQIREGGLAIYGGIIGGLAVCCLVAKLRKVRILPLLDIAGIGFLLGQGIGRWGNFFNQEAFGTNTDSIFGMSGGRIQEWITYSYPNTSYYQNFGTELDASQAVHPCFLYESVWCLLGFVLLAIFAKKIRRYDGQIFLIYIGWYGIERAFVEGLRTDSLVIGNIRISQLLAILCVIASVILQIIIGTKVKRMGCDYHMYKDTDESKRILAVTATKGTAVAVPAEDTAADDSKADRTTSDETDSTDDAEPPAESAASAAQDDTDAPNTGETETTEPEKE
ncbi:MAG: prolipoprotein diacylglyceryl transferase [Ruminococcus sp.]|nr:prolipoprotein diacylglyceryl transferase [Ruminococcus sp.]